MLRQEMLHTKTSVTPGSVTGEEVPGRNPKGIGDGDGQEVGPAIAIEKGIDEIGNVVSKKIGNVVSTKIGNEIVDAIETEIGTGKGTGKENGQRVDHREEIANHPAVVTVINTKKVKEKSGKEAKNQTEISKKRLKMNQRITLNELY